MSSQRLPDKFLRPRNHGEQDTSQLHKGFQQTSYYIPPFNMFKFPWTVSNNNKKYLSIQSTSNTQLSPQVPSLPHIYLQNISFTFALVHSYRTF